ncbi:hypothetical protein [Paenibacillus sp. Marseille-Q4541]|uniref:hypothetical protein n=1 Tax=Paenibacillus sp. Marseille-Q4541 TaxID=2831522 RepID=UPI001BA975A4|nr:hypothetical protein [Paenibacillus sp. Marseille-Q4541]
MKVIETDQTTRNLLMYCYTCEDAAFCTTEEACKACWAEQGLLDNEENQGTEETQQFLRMMHV